METISLREAIRRAVAADSELSALLGQLPALPLDPPTPHPVPDYFAGFPLPPRVAIIDQVVMMLRQHRPQSPVYVDPPPRGGLRLDELDVEAPVAQAEMHAARIVAAVRAGYTEMGSVMRGAWGDGSLARLNGADAAQTVQGLATIWRHGEQSYSVDQIHQYAVSDDEDNLLVAFLDTNCAMETAKLEEVSGVTNVARAVTELMQFGNGIFAAAIRRPGGKRGTGGYYIRVRCAVAIP